MTESAQAYLHKDATATIRDRKLLEWFLPYVKPFRGHVALAFGSLLVCEALPFAFPTLLQKVIDGPVASKDFVALSHWIALYALLVLLHAVFVFFKTWQSQRIGVAVVHRLRTQLYDHLLHLDIPFFQKTPAGRLITRLTYDVDSLQSLLTEGFIDLASSMLMLLFAIGAMFAMDYRLAIATLILMPLLLLVTTLFRKWMRLVNTRLRTEMASLNSSLQENIQGMPLVRLFRKQSERLAAFSHLNHKYNQAAHEQARLYSWFFPLLNIVTEFSLLACYTAGVWWIFQGDMTIGTLAAFAWFASIYNRPLREISDKITNLQSALAAAERVHALANTRTTSSFGNEELPPGPPAIEYRHVDFRYRADQSVLEDISFTIPAGTTTALVGSTGSGKSTIVNLLNRFHSPHHGEILVGGVELHKIAAWSWHRRIATVNQDVFLFAGSLQDNILLGLPFQEQHFLETCRRTRVDILAKRLPHGYASILPEGGKGLSTGERQLVSFARALYADPDLLLLDEATASIDTATEALVQQALSELTRNRTALVVAHRLSTIQDAQQILVLRKGKIVERGSHADLLARDGHYRKLLGEPHLSEPSA